MRSGLSQKELEAEAEAKRRKVQVRLGVGPSCQADSIREHAMSADGALMCECLGLISQEEDTVRRPHE